MTFDMAGGVRSIFRDIAPFIGTWEDKSTAKAGDQSIDITWQGRQISGTVGMRDALKLLADNHNLPELSTDQTHYDFAAYVSTKTVSDDVCQKLLSRRNDPRVLLWAPADLTSQGYPKATFKRGGGGSGRSHQPATAKTPKPSGSSSTVMA
jgi:hypothetical protein